MTVGFWVLFGLLALAEIVLVATLIITEIQ